MPTPDSHARALSHRQRHNITRSQLLDLGFSTERIRHKLATGRLHPVFRGVYAVGRPHDTREAMWMAAVLRGGERAALSEFAAAAHWGFRPHGGRLIDVTVPARRQIREPGIRFHRSRHLSRADVTEHAGIPITTVVRTLIDIAPRLPLKQRERAINEADRLGLVDPNALREALAADGRRLHRANVLRDTLDRRTFTKTRSELERIFFRLVRAAGLPRPLTNQIVNGFEVDFYWPELGLVVETDGLRYHRTPAQQAAGLIRDQAHAAADLTPLHFSAHQIVYEQAHVLATLRAVITRLAASRVK
jgi:very-short-patch-repair endonuclease